MTPPTHGVWPCSSAEYHSSKSADSFSSLELFAESPLKYYRTRIKGDLERDEPSEAMRLGSLIHALVLEPGSVQQRYAVAPDVDRRTKAGKQAYEDFCDRLADREIVGVDTWTAALICRDAIEQSSQWRLLMEGEWEVEQAICWGSIIPLKAKPDLWLPGPRLCVDLKTIGKLDLSIDSIRYEIKARKYNVQAALYLEGIRAVYEVDDPEFVFVFVSTVEPHEVVAYQLGEELIEEGKATLAKWIKDRVECEARGWRRNEDLITRLGAWEKT